MLLLCSRGPDQRPINLSSASCPPKKPFKQPIISRSSSICPSRSAPAPSSPYYPTALHLYLPPTRACGHVYCSCEQRHPSRRKQAIQAPARWVIRRPLTVSLATSGTSPRPTIRAQPLPWKAYYLSRLQLLQLRPCPPRAPPAAVLASSSGVRGRRRRHRCQRWPQRPPRRQRRRCRLWRRWRGPRNRVWASMSRWSRLLTSLGDCVSGRSSHWLIIVWGLQDLPGAGVWLQSYTCEHVTSSRM
jgi:hypothetical protein